MEQHQVVQADRPAPDEGERLPARALEALGGLAGDIGQGGALVGAGGAGGRLLQIDRAEPPVRAEDVEDPPRPDIGQAGPRSADSGQARLDGRGRQGVRQPRSEILGGRRAHGVGRHAEERRLQAGDRHDVGRERRPRRLAGLAVGRWQLGAGDDRRRRIRRRRCGGRQRADQDRRDPGRPGRG